ncbi:MAG: PorV/PorQ family protein [Bacteroidales bacterium]|nr:PorV/PorQ family protein [Bacteroidales bacterium]
MVKANYFSFAFLFVINFMYSQKYSNEFLFLGAGARAFGMGNAVIASTTDATSAYWNPSKLVNLDKNLNFSLMHSNYFGGISKYDFAAVAMKQKDSTSVALTFFRFGVDDIPNTLDIIDANGNIDFTKIKSFSVADYCVMLSYAKLTNLPILFGGNVKFIRRIVGEFASAIGFGFDIAASYKHKRLWFSIVARDVTSTFTYWSYNKSQFEETFIKTGNAIPQNGFEITTPRLCIGAAYYLQQKEKINLLIETNYDFTFDKKRNTLVRTNITSLDPKFGIEASYDNILFIRAGIFNIQQITNEKLKKVLNLQPTVGIGVKYKNISIDYAFTNIANTSVAMYSHVISLNFGINATFKHN